MVWCDKKIWLGASAGCSLMLLASTAVAEFAARPGEYVITPRIAAANGDATQRARILAHGDARELRSLGSALLVKDNRPAGLSTSSTTPEDFCAHAIKSGIARDCSPNYILSVDATPNDPQFGSLWGLSASVGIDAPGAWDVSTGDGSVVVAVIDTGVDYNHADLSANMWTNAGEIAGNGIDDDRNGYVDDVHGINAASGSGNPMDENGHGSHVAGTIGARGNNSVGVAGVNWNVKIMALRFLDANGSGSLADAITAINYMVMMKQRGVSGLRVSNNSWGGGGFSQAMHDAIARARDAGIVFVAAAGNEANDNDSQPAYPASYDLANVISVAAHDRDGNLASFSNYGASSVDIAAPGVAILSTSKHGGYATLSGTSMATPHVAGALALMMMADPSLSNEQVAERLVASGVEAPATTGLTRYGRRLNVQRMVLGDTSPLPSEPTPVACAYTATEIPFAPRHDADESSAVVQADEQSYAEAQLGFAFPYFGTSYTRVILSPNGVIYLQRAPSGMDYQYASHAPLNSIAALHSDLISTSAPYGVRVAGDASSFTIYYYVRHYSYAGEGWAKVWVTLTPDGAIEQHLELSDGAFESYIQSRALIGISGPRAENAVTYAYNNASIRSGLGIRYSGVCDPSLLPPSVHAVALSGVDNKGTLYRYGVRGRGLHIVLSGEGNGSVNLTPSIDGVQCQGTITATLTEGGAAVRATIPTVARKSVVLQVAGSATRSKISVKERFHGKSARGHRTVRRAALKQITRGCERLLASVAAL